MNKSWFLKGAIIFLTGGILFVFLELSIRILYKDELHAVRTTPAILHEFVWGLPRMFLKSQEGRYETNVAGFGGLARVQMQHFEMPKRKGVFRIFCVGESSVQGCPYCGSDEKADPSKAFPAQLQKILETDHKNIEVINAGVGGVSSAQLLPLVKELTRYEPDCIILYAGHNEYGYYYWRPEVLKIPAWRFKVGQWLDRLYVYRLICKMAHRAVPINNEHSTGWRKYNGTPDMRFGKNSLEEQFKNIIPAKEWERFAQNELSLSEWTFEQNISEMQRVLKEKNIKFMICTIVSNLKDYPPIFSFHSPDLSRKDLLRWERLYEKAKGSMVSADLDRTLRDLAQLAALDGKYAETYYLLGQVYYTLRDYDQARKNFISARDLSPAYAPLQRAPSSMNELIRQFVRVNDVYLIDIEKGFYSLNNNFGIPGSDLFFDNLHPNVQGYKLIASLIAQRMNELRIIPSRFRIDTRGKSI